MISKEELYVLSYYRAGELAGAVLFGRMAIVTNIDEIRISLTNHCLEEAEHGWVWTKTIQDLGHTPLKVTNVYQTEYGKKFGIPKNMLEILCLTQVLEKRVLNHFNKHLLLPNVHPLIQKALKKMIEDETGHIGWVKQKLDQYSKEHGPETVNETMKRLTEIDERVYKRLSEQSPFKELFGGNK